MGSGSIVSCFSFQMKLVIGLVDWTIRILGHFGKSKSLEFKPQFVQYLCAELLTWFHLFVLRFVDSWNKLTTLFLALIMELPVNTAEKAFYFCPHCCKRLWPDEHLQYLVSFPNRSCACSLCVGVLVVCGRLALALKCDRKNGFQRYQASASSG